MPRLLPPDRVAALRAAPFTYAEVGATGDESAGLPAGYHVVRRSRALARRDLDGAVRDLLAWQVQERAGLRLAVSGTPVEAGTVVVQRLGVGPVAVAAPCRVVYVVDEPDRGGFAYGTLPGHPESGEERFVVSRGPDGTLTVTITAFSRPATPLTRVAAPAARRVQALVTGRYLRSLDR